MTHTPDPMLSDAANGRQRKLAYQMSRGRVRWTDLIGLAEPNPDLPDCQSWDGTDGPKCERPNHHDGPHRAVVEW